MTAAPGLEWSIPSQYRPLISLMKEQNNEIK